MVMEAPILLVHISWQSMESGMGDRFDLRMLSVPLIVAPMAGGPSTPELVAAASNAGGLGVLAGGLLSADGLAASIVASRAITTGPLGVNLFVPQASAGSADVLADYALALAPEAQRRGVELGTPFRHEGGWQAKLAVLLECDLRWFLSRSTLPTPQRAHSCVRRVSRPSPR